MPESHDYLKGKNITLVCPKFFGYEKHIKETIQGLGAKVSCVYENINATSNYYRSLFKYHPEKRAEACEKYYRKKLKRLDRTDIFLVIRGSTLTVPVMEYVKSAAPKHCRFIMLQWDSVKNTPNALEIESYFERKLTFDPVDAEKYGWIYRPDFYIDEYACASAHKSNDLLFLCSMIAERISLLNKLKKFAKVNNYSLKTFVYTNFPVFFKRKYINHTAISSQAELRDMIFRPMPIKKAYNLYRTSRVIVDYTNPQQTGYPLRVFECLVCGCKLATSNPYVKNADFYDPENIYVYDPEGDFSIPEDFIKSPFRPVSPEIMKKYSLTSWVKDIFDMQ